MRVVIDACVLYPTVLREIVLAVAAHDLFTPLWSARILEEWARATVKLGAGAEAVARGEIALLGVRFPHAMVPADIPLEQSLLLDDINDRHVLATAITGHADLILTDNLRDFPSRALAPHGVRALDPDRFLIDLLAAHPKTVAGLVERIRAEAERLSGQPQPLRPLMKRAGLPRLGKALA